MPWSNGTMTTYNNDHEMYAEGVGSIQGITYSYRYGTDPPVFAVSAGSRSFVNNGLAGISGSVMFETVDTEQPEQPFTMVANDDEFKYIFHQVELLELGSLYTGKIRSNRVYNFVCPKLSKEVGRIPDANHDG